MDNKLKLDSRNGNKWKRNTLIYTIPAVIVYLSSVLTGIQDNSVTVSDFIPSAVAWGGFITYLISVLQDYLLKLQSQQNT